MIPSSSFSRLRANTGRPTAAPPPQQTLRFQGVPGALVPTPIQFPLIGHVVDSQSQRIYAVQIAGRVAYSRDPTEAREHLVRDVLGASSWFWLVPIVRTLYIQHTAPEAVRQMLLLPKPAPVPQPGQAPWQHQLEKLNYHVLGNPLARWHLVSLSEIKNRRRDLQAWWQQAHAHLSPEARQAAEAPVLQMLDRLVGWRKAAMGLGLTLTLLTLGIGINLLNIWMTKREVARRQQRPTPPANGG
jgi:hypothetical protein